MNLFKSLLFLLILSFGPIKAYEHNLVVCAIFKDNAPYLKEWIEFHRMVGVTHFYLFDNDSQDHPKTVLQPYIDNKIVTLIPWPNKKLKSREGKLYGWVETTQKSAYLKGLKLAKKKARWVAMIDTDEFMVPMQDKDLNNFLKNHESDPGLAINWECYGTSNVQSIPTGKLMIEMLIMKSFSYQYINTYTKLIVNPRKFHHFTTIPHRARYDQNIRSTPISRDLVRINHYINRTLDFFYSQKIKAKEDMENRKLDEQEIQSFLNVGMDMEDHEMDRFIPELRKRVFN